MFDPADAPDPDDVYGNYLKTCAMLGIDPVPRARALGWIQEWTEALSGVRSRPRTSASSHLCESRPSGRFSFERFRVVT